MRYFSKKMCWNAEVSFQTFGMAALAVAVAAIYSNIQWPYLFFFMTIASMQLVEGLVWQNLNNPSINHWLSLAGNMLLALQPVGAILTLYGTQTDMMYKLLAAYFGTVGITQAFLLPLRREPFDKLFRMYVGENGHLVWNWLNRKNASKLSLTVYFIFLVLPFLLSKHYGILLFTFLTLGVSLATFYQYETWGSMWCWFVNFGVIGFILAAFRKQFMV